VRTLLHLVRAGARPDVMADRDWVVYLGDGSPQLAGRGNPPIPPGPIDHDQLVALAFAADLVVTW
jgi:hypothetical protein